MHVTEVMNCFHILNTAIIGAANGMPRIGASTYKPQRYRFKIVVATMSRVPTHCMSCIRPNSPHQTILFEIVDQCCIRLIYSADEVAMNTLDVVMTVPSA